MKKKWCYVYSVLNNLIYYLPWLNYGNVDVRCQIVLKLIMVTKEHVGIQMINLGCQLVLLIYVCHFNLIDTGVITSVYYE